MPSSASPTSPSFPNSAYKALLNEEKSFLLAPLKEILNQVHPNYVVRDEALSYVEERLQYVLKILCAEQPHKISDVEERIKRSFPDPLSQMAITFAQTATLEKGKKRLQLFFPTAKMHAKIQEKYLPHNRDLSLTCYLCAVLEFIASDILKLAGKYIANIHHSEITEEDINVSIFADKVLTELFDQDEQKPMCLMTEDDSSRKASLTYEDAVKDLIQDEKLFIRELNMLIKVFKATFVNASLTIKLTSGISPAEIDAIFGNIEGVLEASVKFLDLLEDSAEIDGPNGTMGVGSVFEEIMEAQEFDVFRDYALRHLNRKPLGCNGTVVHPQSPTEILHAVINRTSVATKLAAVGNGFLDAVKHVLPRLLLNPIFRVSQYSESLRVLQFLLSSVDQDVTESLAQSEGQLRPIVEIIEKMWNNTSSPYKHIAPAQAISRGRRNRHLMHSKIEEILKSIDGRDNKNFNQARLEFVLEGDLTKINKDHRGTDRHIFLFDTQMVLCKAKQPKPTNGGPEYRFKEKLILTKLSVIERPDTDDLKFIFELIPGDLPNVTQKDHIILSAASLEEKNMWLGSLFMLQTRGMLDRMLDKAIDDENNAHPLGAPMVIYTFSAPDSPTNIVFEEGSNLYGVPLIKGATLVKLVERLTFNEYADPMFVKTFLITFRSFATPMQLMKLLVERFNIPPDPIFPDPAQNCDVVKPVDFNPDLSRKRFRKEYCQPVQFRVLNVIRHWVDYHFLDFESDEQLLKELRNFLNRECEENRRSFSMKKWIDSIRTIIDRKLLSGDITRETTFPSPKPDVETHIESGPDGYDLMTMHPVEIARQLTLMEFEIYRSIRSSELVGWHIEKDKERTSPNVRRSIQFTTKITHAISKYIVGTENLEERVAVMNRVIEIMREFDKLNNFSGVMEIHCALESAAVYRLEKTKESLSAKNTKFMKEIKDSCPTVQHGKIFFQKLRSINPPCIPFLGLYLTQLLHIEEGNVNFLNGSDNLLPADDRLINFNKRRKTAEIVTEIQQYQNQPYCLTVVQPIRDFFETLEPCEGLGEKEFADQLHKQSLKIEPRDCPCPPKFPKRFNFNLRSPSVRPSQLPSSKGMSSAPSTQSINSMVTSPSSHKPLDGDKSKTPSTPSTPRSPLDTLSEPTSRSSLCASREVIPETSVESVPLPPPPPLPPRQKPGCLTGDSSPRSRDIWTRSVESSSLFSFNPPPLTPAAPSTGAPPLPPSRQQSILLASLPPTTFPPTITTDESFDDNLSPCLSMSPPHETPPPLPPRRSHRPNEQNGSRTPELPPKQRLTPCLLPPPRKHSQ